MPNRFASLLAASVLALAGGALAQPPSSATPAKPDTSPTVAPVIVQAPSTPKVIKKQAHAFVDNNATVGNPRLEQIVRWRDPVCVQVEGLVPNQDESIQARIGDVAKALDLHVRGRGCRANIQIVFTDQPQAVMDRVYKRQEWMLGYYHAHEGARLKTVTRPIQAWRVTATLGRSAGTDLIGRFLPEEIIDDPENPAPMGCADNPHFTGCRQGVIKNVFVVVDNRSLGDHSLGLITDYLAMVALAVPKSMDGCNDLPSVIDIYAPSACPGRDPPDGLTPADASYLTALYSAEPEENAWVERGDIANRMARILVRANAASK